jgi:hypothetical protein
MQTRPNRMWFLATAVAIAWVLGTSGRSDAQLFPNLPIRRPKVPCDQEAPYYKVFRQHYNGYFPTCWRPFPKGWGCPCPSPERPDWAGAKEKVPLQTDLEYFSDLNPPDEGAGPDEMQGPPGRGVEPNLPPVRSPFEMDTPPARGGRDREGGTPGGAARRGNSRGSNGEASAIPDSLPPIGFPEASSPNPTVLPTRDEPSATNRQDPTVGPTSVYLAPTPAKRSSWMSSLLNFGRR